MNRYEWLVVVALIGEYLLTMAAERLNLGTLSQGVPPEMAAVVDQTAYQKIVAYARSRASLEGVRRTVVLAISLLFWQAGGFNGLDQWARGVGSGPISTGLLYLGGLAGFTWLLGLPFQIYDTFRVEQAFGFNRTTPGTFLLDQFKMLVLLVLLGGGLLSGVLVLFQEVGEMAWLACWLGAASFLLLIQYVAPRWLLPLFNRFTPLPDGELKEEILAFTRAVSFPVAGIFEIDGSLRSTKANAFFTGFGANRRIALFDTLIRQHTVAELVAVLAHEIGHYQHRHIWKNMAIGLLHLGVMFYLVGWFQTKPELFAAFYLDQASIYAGMAMFGWLFAPIELLLAVLMNALSRRYEFQADRFAAMRIPEPMAMADALRKLAASNLSHLTPHWLEIWLHYSHPPVVQRIQAIEQLARSRGTPPA